MFNDNHQIKKSDKNVQADPRIYDKLGDNALHSSNTNDIDTNGDSIPTTMQRSRIYSISSDIIPQTLTHPNDENKRLSKSPINGAPSWSHVGFQSIFNNNTSNVGTKAASSRTGDVKRVSSTTSLTQSILPKRLSRQSLPSSTESSKRTSNSHNDSGMRPSIDYPDHSSLSEELNDSEEEDQAGDLQDVLSSHSHGSASKSTRGTLSRQTSSLFGLSKEKIDDKMFSSKSSKKSTTLRFSKNPIQTNSKGLKTVAKKLFNRKTHRNLITDTDLEPDVPSSLSKFLHSSYVRHKSPSQFIHANAATGIIDSARSVHSFNPSLKKVMDSQQDDSITTANVVMLHELLKNLPSLEANYKNFSIDELHVLADNVWGIYCNTAVELFKNKRIWELSSKIEDIGRAFEFYTFLKTESKIAVPCRAFLAEINEFINTSLYILENQIVFNYVNENIMNTALKRLAIIWQLFYQKVFYDVMPILLPLEQSFRKNKSYWAITPHNDGPVNKMFSVDYILLKCFRDSIVLPYYRNFINSHDGASKSFQKYIVREEEENGVTEKDKLILLQCFGLLNTIKGNDRNQKIIEELLQGIRLTI